MQPLIGLTGRRKPGSEIGGLPGVLSTIDVDVFFGHYTRAVVAAGGLPVFVSADTPLDVVERLDGLVLSGGADLHPDAYGGEVTSDLTALEPDRDAFEFGLLDAARDVALPILGICRGFQLLNVRAGGTMNAHVPEHGRHDLPVDHLLHDVEFVPGSTLAGLYGERTSVNSLHHQTIAAVGAGVIACGHSVGDVEPAIEAIEFAGEATIGVQWHPEMLRGPDPVHAWLIGSATERALRR